MSSNDWRVCLATLLLTTTCPVHAQHTQDSLIDPMGYQGLTADRRAHRVGDALTVIVLQSSSASASANTDANNSVGLTATARDQHADYGGALGFAGNDTGIGQTSRSGVVQAQLSVRVIKVAANGMLEVQGSQSMAVNGEAQRIQLSGWVRPEDVSAADTVISSRITDAHIEFTGRGAVSDAQHRGLLYRFARWLGLI